MHLTKDEHLEQLGELAFRLTGHANLKPPSGSRQFLNLADILDRESGAAAQYRTSVLDAAASAGTVRPDTGLPQRAWFAARPVVPGLATAWATLTAVGIDPKTLDTSCIELAGPFARATNVESRGVFDEKAPIRLGPEFLRNWLLPATLAVMPDGLRAPLRRALSQQIAKRGLAVFAGRAAMYRNGRLDKAIYEASEVLDATVADIRPKGQFVLVTSGDRGIIEWAPGASCKQYEDTHACPTCPLDQAYLAKAFKNTSRRLRDDYDRLPEPLRLEVKNHQGLDPGAVARKVTGQIERTGLPLSTAPPESVALRMSVGDLTAVAATAGLDRGPLRPTG